jgi:hypothetical protein
MAVNNVASSDETDKSKKRTRKSCSKHLSESETKISQKIVSKKKISRRKLLRFSKKHEGKL